MITEISAKTKITMVVIRNSTDILILRNIPINTYSTHVPSGTVCASISQKKYTTLNQRT